MLVVDASVASAWLLDDERDLSADPALATLDRALQRAARDERVPVIAT